MKAKTLVQLLGLTVSLYSLSKDEELKEKVKDITRKGKEKINGLYEEFSGNTEEELTEKIMATALKAKEEFEQRVEEFVSTVYDKMKIAHTKDMEVLREELAGTQQELANAKERIAALENSTL
jgi:hypothetical protein